MCIDTRVDRGTDMYTLVPEPKAEPVVSEAEAEAATDICIEAKDFRANRAVLSGASAATEVHVRTCHVYASICTALRAPGMRASALTSPIQSKMHTPPMGRSNRKIQICHIK